MSVIWYAPGEGLGKPSRAAAVCRHIPGSVVVRVGVWKTPLDHAGVEYVQVWSDEAAPAVIEGLNPDLLVVDQSPDAPEVQHFREAKTLHLYRFGRSFTESPGVLIEGSREGWVDMWPVLYYGPENLPSREESREHYDIPDDIHLTVVEPSVKTNTPLRDESMEGDKWTKVVRHWPGVGLLAGADRVVGAPGYNLWNEVNALGITDADWSPIENQADQQLRMNEPWREYTGNKDRALADYIMEMA